MQFSLTFERRTEASLYLHSKFLCNLVSNKRWGYRSRKEQEMIAICYKHGFTSAKLNTSSPHKSESHPAADAPTMSFVLSSPTCSACAGLTPNSLHAIQNISGLGFSTPTYEKYHTTSLCLQRSFQSSKSNDCSMSLPQLTQ